jgi:hypothetical protein
VSCFFFDLYDDVVVSDDEGQDLPDLAAARITAIKSARQIACAQVLNGRLNLTHRIEVRDESGSVVTTVLFGDVIKVTA